MMKRPLVTDLTENQYQHHEAATEQQQQEQMQPQPQDGGLQQQEEQRARNGDIVKIQLDLRPENGYVPEPLFDTSGTITFVLGWGNYLPGVHELVRGCRVGDTMNNVSIDAGWGDRLDDMIVRVPIQKLYDAIRNNNNDEQNSGNNDSASIPELKPGETTLRLRGGIEVLVTDVDDENVVLDANPPLAGTSYACTFTVLSIDSLPSIEYSMSEKGIDESAEDNHYGVATFALGCFWGAELAYMRVPGVVGTKVGYTQGVTKNPTYDEVCSGRTQHREAVMVIFDRRVASYERLVQIALEQLRSSAKSPLLEIHNLFHHDKDDDDTKQYRYGFYYHDEDQRTVAERYLKEENSVWEIEVLQASILYDAEEMMQQYLFKSGQSARKGSKEKIRCYG